MTAKLEELKALAKEATQGTWFSDGRDLFRELSDDEARALGFNPALLKTRRMSLLGIDKDEYAIVDTEADAEYIAAMNPETALALIAEVERLSKTLSELRTKIQPLADQIICPKDNTFSRMLKSIDEALQQPKE